MKVFIGWSQKEDGDMSSPENRRNFLVKNNLENKTDVVIKQVHGRDIIFVEKTPITFVADGMITNNKELALFIRVADCLPILFHDTHNNIVGTVHAGRESTFKNISGNMIDTFVSTFKSSPSDIQVYIGPSIGVCCYEVSEEMAKKVKEDYGQSFLKGRNINLQKINEHQLLAKSILQENIHIS